MEPLKNTGPTEEKGTSVAFKADAAIFEETTEYDYDTLLRRLREQAFLNAGVYIVLRDQRGTEPVEEHLHYEGGIRSFVEHIHKSKGVEPIMTKLFIWRRATAIIQPRLPCSITTVIRI